MAKKTYVTAWMDLGEDDDGNVVIEFGASQGTSGTDSVFSFSGISDDDLTMIELNCDDLDLAEMDANHDYIITDVEFQAWYNANHPW